MLADVAPNSVSLAQLDGILLIVGIVVPFITALGAKYDAPDWLKGLISITASAIIAYVRLQIDSNQEVTWEAFVNGFIQVWGAALITWLGITADAVARVNQTTGHVGLGFRHVDHQVPPMKVTPKPSPPPPRM
jgi:hypothetical protein